MVRPVRRPAAQAPQLAYQAALVAKSIEELGAKWTLLLLRDIAYLKIGRFGALARNNPGLSRRVLARRLRELTRDGLVEKRPDGSYAATPKGEDALGVLHGHLRFALRHHGALARGVPDPVGAYHLRLAGRLPPTR